MRMRHDSLRRAAGIVLAALVVLAAWSPPFRSLVDCPSELRLVVGEEERVHLLGLPLSAVITGDADGVLHINGEAPSAGRWLVDLGRPLELSPLAEGRCRLDLSLLGILPVKRITVQVVPRVRVVPGGQSIGIVLRTKGVAVVGHAPVKTPDEGPVYPAREAGVQVGDVILRVDGQEVKSNEHIVFLVNRCAREGRPVPLELSRDGRTVRLEVTPRYSAEDGFYQIGLYVRDGAAGVGTLTFYDPETRIFMALGHVITDAATNRPLELGDGRIVKASVVRVRPGRRGEPGEKEGTFVDDEDVIGVITGN
ncbi:MAG TPA: SpoIVB peptidase, partial [Clostridiales bacterium]|nr:SpoIVB peptidase [Clostridiales bacterium]